MDSYKVMLKKRKGSPEDWTSNTVRLTHLKDNKKTTNDTLFVVVPKEKIIEEGISAIMVIGYDGMMDWVKIAIDSANGEDDTIFTLIKEEGREKEDSSPNNIYPLPSII